jgi:hypothetical protein
MFLRDEQEVVDAWRNAYVALLPSQNKAVYI